MTTASRHDRLDALRGIAIVWMAGFHFCFDLNLFGLMRPPQAFTADPFWTVQRACIVTLFVLCAGLGQAVALAGSAPRLGAGFWRRWAQVAACAVAVSAGSALMFPRSWISFGVLHGMALMLLLCRLFAPRRAARASTLALLGAGAAALVLPLFVQSAFFDTRLTNWVGLTTRKPVTEDWVPLLPWLGVMLWGLAAGQWLLQHKRELLAGPLARPLQPLARLGRWSLSFYMVHQLVFIGALMGGRRLGLW